VVRWERGRGHNLRSYYVQKLHVRILGPRSEEVMNGRCGEKIELRTARRCLSCRTLERSIVNQHCDLDPSLPRRLERGRLSASLIDRTPFRGTLFGSAPHRNQEAQHSTAQQMVQARGSAANRRVRSRESSIPLRHLGWGDRV